MRDECGSEVTRTMRAATERMEAPALVGGVRWLGGVPASERSLPPAQPADLAATTFVIGRAHGHRLLELCAAG